MGSWPWPLDGVEKWFQNLWDWVGKAAVSAVSVVSKWIKDAVAGLWKTVSGAFDSLGDQVTKWFDQIWKWIQTSFTWVWDNVSAGLDGLGTQISDAFSAAWTSISDALGQVQTGLTDFFTTVWDSLAGAIGDIGTTLGQGITDLGGAVGGFFGDLWTNITNFVGGVADGINQGINAVGGAVGSAVNTIGTWVSDALKGMASAMGTALQGFVDYIWKGLQTAGQAIVGFVSQDIIAPLLGVLDWIRDAILNILRDLWSSITGFFGQHSPITPEEAAGFTVPLLLISSSAGFGVSVMGAIGSMKAMGTGVEARAISDYLKDAFAMADVSRSLIMPIFSAAYEQPIRHYYNSIYRPRIPDTRTADQMLFEEHIDEAEWRQIYRYNGWKEQHIDAWFKTMWREPSLLVLRNLVLDPDVDEAWVRKKMREGGLIGEDADAMIAYGRRASLKDERTALASQIEKDVVEGFESLEEARSDLNALKYTPEEIDYRITKFQFLINRAERAALVKAAKTPAPKKKGVSESDLDQELLLGLITPSEYMAGLQQLEFSADAAQRKYRLLTTPRPVSPAELARRRQLVESQIAKVQQRYDIAVARQDLTLGFYSDMIEYLSSLEKPPVTRIVTLQEQLNKAAGERALIIQQRDAEIADLNAQLQLVQAG